jgi:HK97 family phage major capsid protein
MKRRKAAVIAKELEVQRSVITEVGAMEAPSDEDVERSEAALEQFEALQTEYDEAVKYEARISRAANFAADGHVEPADGETPEQVKRSRSPEFKKSVEPFEILRSTAGMDEGEIVRGLADANLKAIEEFEMPAGYKDSFQGYIKRHKKNTAWTRNLLERMRPEYIGAFEKAMVGREVFMTDVERAAIAVGTNTAGGYLVPTHLDPTLILTNAGARDVVRGISRVVTLVNGANAWNGVTTAGATASWDAELTEVSDDTPPVGPASVPVHSAKSLIQASIESFEDITGLASDVQMLLRDARVRLEAAAHLTGSGSGQPTGIFTALDANTNVELQLTTGRTWTRADIARVTLALGDRWTDSSRFLMNPAILEEIAQLGTALGTNYTTDLTQPYTQQLLGFPITLSHTAPKVNQTTTVDNLLVFGDFSNYVIVDKPGSTSIEFIPHMFNTSNNLPDGRRAWYMHFRNGADSVNDLAFRLLQDRTTA